MVIDVKKFGSSCGVILFSLGLTACQTTGSSIPSEGKTLTDYPLVVCAKNQGKTELLAYTHLGNRPVTNRDSAYCQSADYVKGEIAGYLKDGGNYFSGLKGEFNIVCAEGFIALGDPFEIPKSCALN